MSAEIILQATLTAVSTLCVWIFNAQKNSFDAFAKDSIKKIDALTGSINNLNVELAKIMTILEQYGEEINELKNKKPRRQNARRSSKIYRR